MDENKYFECLCGGEIIKMSHYEDECMVCFSIFRYIKKQSRWGYIKKIIKNKEPYLDDVMLNYKELYNLKVEIDKVVKQARKNCNEKGLNK